MVAIVGLGLALARPGGPILGDRTESTDVHGVLPPIDFGSTLEQDFVAAADGLSSVSVRIGTYGGNDRCTLEVSLHERLTAGRRPTVGRALAERTWPCGALPDSEVVEVLRFAAIPGSAERTYTLRIYTDPESEQLVSAFGGPNSEAPPARLDGRRVDGSAEIHSGYGDAAHAWDLVGTALRRMADYGPVWDGGLWTVFLVALAIAAVGALAAVRGQRVVVVLVVLATAKGLLWSAALPPLEGVDEGAHVAYAQFLAEDHAIPNRGHPIGSGRNRSFSPELQEATARFSVVTPAPGDRAPYGAASETTKEALDGLDRSSNGDGPAAGYAPHFYAVPGVLERLPGTIDVRIGYMRLWSIALGVLTVVAAWALGRRLFPGSDTAARLLALAVALHPMASQQTATVNNDAGVIAAGAWCLVAAIDLSRSERSNHRLPLLAGLVGGTTFLVKGFAAAVLPLLVLAWLIGRSRGQRPVPWWRDALAGAGGFAASYGTWFVVAAVMGRAGVGLSGDPSPGPRGWQAFTEALSGDSWRLVRIHWIEQFWGNFSWVDRPYPSWAYETILIGVVAGLAVVAVWLGRLAIFGVGWLWAAARGAPRPAAPGPVDAVPDGLVLGAAVAGTLAVLFIIMFLNFQEVGRLDLVQGRYGLLVAPAVLALPPVLLRALVPRLSPVPLLAVEASAMALLNILGLALIVERFYL